MIEQLEKMEQRYREIDEKMARPEVATDIALLQELAQERAGLQDAVSLYRNYRTMEKDLEETRTSRSAPCSPKRMMK